MSILKIACLSIAATSIIAFAPHAHANSFGTNGAYYGTGNISGFHGVSYSAPTVPEATYTSVSRSVWPLSLRQLGGSTTATTKFARGLSQFEKGNLDDSAYAFRSALRANGSKEMDRLSLHYLTLISDKQGDEINTKKYAQAYFELTKK